MDKNEMIKLIDNKVKSDKEKKEQKERQNEDMFNEYTIIINSLADRISKLLDVAWYAIDNGIKIRESSGTTDSYERGVFFSNSWSHLVGIKDRKHLGITKGGACGNIDFYTDGKEIYGYDTSSKTKVKPLLNDMIRFVNRFDEFESMLYTHIEKECAA